jgi:hypothetical protein
MLTDIAQEDLQAYVGASGAKLAKCLWERKIFRTKSAENNETRIIKAYHFLPANLTPFAIIQQTRRHANIYEFSHQLKHNGC